ncbi:MAG: type transport system permease protein [Streptosporangiaceae bacterium]|nr:type transport system permease protein [Streptosporangiaceae bacterium]
MRQQLEVAVRHSLAAQARNRLAWILLVLFVPGWYLLIGSMIPHKGAAFILRSNGTRLVVDGHDLTLITAGLSAITLITGFVVFAATRRAIPFDRRLILSGYRPAALITAKTTAALAVAAAVGAYAAVVILAFWRPAGLWSIAVAFILAAASYAALGLLVGVLVRGDLEGFFLIIMTAMLDTFLENPVDNPLANKPVLEFFPSYAPTQFAAAGAFHHQVLASMAALSLAWTAAFALLGLAVLRLRLPQPARRPQQASSTSQQARTAPGPGTPLAGPDSNRSTAPVTSPAPRPGPRGPSRPSRHLSPQPGPAEPLRHSQNR